MPITKPKISNFFGNAGLKTRRYEKQELLKNGGEMESSHLCICLFVSNRALAENVEGWFEWNSIYLSVQKERQPQPTFIYERRENSEALRNLQKEKYRHI